MKTIIHIDNYQPNELNSLINEGFSVQNIIRGNFPEALEKRNIEVLVRGPKMTGAEYRELYGHLHNAGLVPTTSPESYDVLYDSSVYEEFLNGLVPDKKVFQLFGENVRDEIATLKGWGTIFIRSERGSVAKFEGVDYCMISEWDTSNIQNKIEKTRKHFPEAKNLIARKVMPIREFSGDRVEGRFIVLNGKVTHMDHCEISDTNAALQYNSRRISSAQEVAERFRKGGVTGDYFVDIAETGDDDWFVVEVKPFLNGTIRDTNSYMAALQVS